MMAMLGPVEHGCLAGATYVASPNFNERPPEIPIDLLVIHNISLPPARFGGSAVIDFFCNQLDWEEHPYFKTIEGICVSAHLFIRRDGQVIQFVPFDKRAWHAGKSCYQGRENCNDFSIGIELEGTDDIPYTSEQYVVLASVIRLLCQAYPSLTTNGITGHADIAPDRKTDPGAVFDWHLLDVLLSADLDVPDARKGEIIPD